MSDADHCAVKMQRAPFSIAEGNSMSKVARLYMWMSRIVGKDCVETTFSVVVRRVIVVT